MDEYEEQIQNMKGDGPAKEDMDEHEKLEEVIKKNRGLDTEEELRRIFRSDCPEMVDSDARIDRTIDLLTDLIAERSEEKAEEIIENHKFDYDHDLLYGR